MSGVHVFFDIDMEKKKYVCRLCKDQLEVQASASTGSRQTHLTGVHKIANVNEGAASITQAIQGTASAPSGSGRQTTLERFDPTLTEAQKKRIRRAIANWLIADELPFAVAGSPRLADLLALLHPASRTCIPAPDTLFKSHLPTIYEETKAFIKEELKKPRSPISWSLDGWTDSHTSNHYVLMSVGYVAGDQLQRVCVRVEHMPEGQEAAQMAVVVKNTLTEFGITDAWIGVSDTAANMRALCLNTLQHCWLPCIAHTLNLVINDAVTALGDGHVVETLNFLNTIIRFFHQSSIASACLTKEIDGNSVAILGREREVDPLHPKVRQVPPKKLKARAPTRWNSLIDMLRRFYTLSPAVCRALLDAKVSVVLQFCVNVITG